MKNMDRQTGVPLTFKLISFLLQLIGPIKPTVYFTLKMKKYNESARYEISKKQ